MNSISQVTLAYIHWNQKFLSEHLSRVSWLPMCWNTNHDMPLVIISYFDVLGTRLAPHKTNSILFIDTNAVCWEVPPMTCAIGGRGLVNARCVLTAGQL